jgi:glycosyltransferase involved in cell wall biosynthesis
LDKQKIGYQMLDNAFLDIDDWELGLARSGRRSLSPRRRRKSYLTDAAFLYRPSSFYNCWLGERLRGRADAVTVSNRFLQRRFGGVLVPHARDTDALDPARFRPEEAGARWNIPAAAKVITFFGTPRPHKGVEDLIEAVALREDPRLLVLVAGMDGSAYCRGLRATGKNILRDRFLPLGRIPFPRLGEVLSRADLVVIPQRDSPAGRGQLPAKVFDAMAMAKPIVATRVSDLPEILGGCGWLAEPGDPPELSRVIAEALSDPAGARELGQRARRRCVENYSYNALEPVLVKIFSRFES